MICKQLVFSIWICLMLTRNKYMIDNYCSSYNINVSCLVALTELIDTGERRKKLKLNLEFRNTRVRKNWDLWQKIKDRHNCHHQFLSAAEDALKTVIQICGRLFWSNLLMCYLGQRFSWGTNYKRDGEQSNWTGINFTIWWSILNH